MHTTKYSKKQHKPVGPYVKKYKGGFVTGYCCRAGRCDGGQRAAQQEEQH